MPTLSDLSKFSHSKDLAEMEAMVADGTIKDVNVPVDEEGNTALIWQCYVVEVYMLLLYQLFYFIESHLFMIQ